MDATIQKNKLEFSNIRHNLHYAKDWIFEKSGKINKVWALSIFFTPEISLVLIMNSTQAGLKKPAAFLIDFIELTFTPLTIKDKRI